jgi:hypothetical protein
VTRAVDRLKRRTPAAHDDRAPLVRERDRTAAGIRHLLDAVKGGRATDTLLGELATQEARVKALERRIAECDGRPVIVPSDAGQLTTHVLAAAATFRTTLQAGGPRARVVLQRVLNGRRLPCEAFRDADRKGYRFRADDIPYASLLFDDVRGPKGISTSVNALDLGAFTLAGLATA